TRCTMEALLEDLARTRERGYSMSVEEVNEGAAGVGAAVLDHSGRPVCAISVGGPKSRMSAERMAQLGEKVKAIAAKASAALVGAPAAGPGQRCGQHRCSGSASPLSPR
ncbi:MAG: hypothetical protein K6T30_10195, partial [Alicyclobacillus sp.]|nr:hypothetical protein [Alicyclobacillus sp.]